LLTLVFHFLDHMLHQQPHGLIDLEVQATGDLQIDDHTNEDVRDHFGAEALGKALGSHKGIVRFGISSLPWMKP